MGIGWDDKKGKEWRKKEEMEKGEEKGENWGRSRGRLKS